MGNVNSSFQIEDPLNMSHASVLDPQNPNAHMNSLQQQISDGFFAQFTSTEEVYKYLVQVGTQIVSDREKITQFFKKI